jgi:hypothetical protein
MKGLFLKDIINLKQQAKIYLLIIAIWLAIGFSNKDSAFFGGVIAILTLMIPITALAYDEKAKWDRYALTMPVSKLDMVLAKYLLALAFAAAGALLSSAAGILITKNIVESLTLSLAFLSLGVIFASIVLPIIFKFGVEKGRILMLVVIMVPTLLTMLLPRLNLGAISENCTIINSHPYFFPYS